MTTQETTKSYAALEDKVTLLQEHGIEVLYHYLCENQVQVMFIPGDLETLRTSIKLATDYNIRICRVNLSQDYDMGNEPCGDLYYELIF